MRPSTIFGPIGRTRMLEAMARQYKELLENPQDIAASITQLADRSTSWSPRTCPDDGYISPPPYRGVRRPDLEGFHLVHTSIECVALQTPTELEFIELAKHTARVCELGTVKGTANYDYFLPRDGVIPIVPKQVHTFVFEETPERNTDTMTWRYMQFGLSSTPELREFKSELILTLLASY